MEHTIARAIDTALSLAWERWELAAEIGAGIPK
jgi:hypothetical protein